jgi:hypothetical protein
MKKPTRWMQKRRDMFAKEMIPYFLKYHEKEPLNTGAIMHDGDSVRLAIEDAFETAEKMLAESDSYEMDDYNRLENLDKAKREAD